ncbi:coenzyme Q-binding protein COQ10 [Faunimonas pinastri]|uniref:Coenzyme Q-binding protein COQ10 n=1 Tax=Faunimonas pinastri TaxID=1855383 RepID=A0A1H9KB81_9HYPH|nr:type II toxin-antitoxin system RatA family toxin [Faunimonas pinastri]SEQ96318.1 coenzyme Q-binding protein COQ10 [Faunimonas pinastri]
MPQFESHRRVHHSAEDMFALVADMEKYPEFLPLCDALATHTRTERDGKTLLVSVMTVGYKAIRQTFTTQVVLDPAKQVIDVRYIDGPFKFLNSRWRFEPAEGDVSCRVHFLIDYEFKSLLLGALMGSMFDRAFQKFAEAFEARADQIYS